MDIAGEARRPKAIVYVDGLNLYRRSLHTKDEFKWLDIVKLCELLIPNHEIVLVRYFTARVKPSISGEAGMARQLIYLRALRTHGERLTIHEGRMRIDPRVYPLHPRTTDEFGEVATTKVQKVEEKGSDVALASFMVFDAAKSDVDLHVLLSNDSDFIPTLQIVSEELNKPIAWITPSATGSKELASQNFAFVREVRPWSLKNAQFPDYLTDNAGKFHKPEKWS